MNARYQDPVRGQFISEDPALAMLSSGQELTELLKDPQKRNFYSYSQDNPITRVDPSGLSDAYFAAHLVGNTSTWAYVNSLQDIGGLLGGEHNYAYFNIDTRRS